jgi:hypothetical protein
MSDWDNKDGTEVGGTEPGEDALVVRPDADDEQLVEEIAEDVRHDILLGHVEDDVSHVLEERLEEVGLKLPAEDLDELADEIENDVSS